MSGWRSSRPSDEAFASGRRGSALPRRDFLRRAAIGVAALTLPPPTLLEPFTLPRRGHSRQRVLVVGAGLAGMAAALELVEAGHEVTVLEARLRPGGRVFTLRDRFADGLHAETGAARIPESHDLTLGYARRFDLPIEPFLPEHPLLFRIRGEVFPEPEVATEAFPLPFAEHELGERLEDLAGRYLAPLMAEVGDITAPDWPPASLAAYDSVSIAGLLRDAGASEALIEYLDAGYGLLRRYSGLEGMMLAAGGAFDPLVRIAGGTDRLPRAMATELGDRIVYGAPVRRIEQDGDEASAVVEVGGSHRRYAADRMIVTVPFSVLGAMEISPRFSAPKMRAIHEMSYEDVSRVYLQTGERFWRAEEKSGFAFTDDPMEIWDATYGQTGERGILMAYLRGGLARRVESLAPAERVAFGLDRVGRVFPGVRDHFHGGTSWAWGEERWSRGAYAFSAPDELVRLHGPAGTPEGRIHFAGEHTSVWPGWMQGALHSGLRAAREVSERSVAAGSGAAERARAGSWPTTR